MRRGRPTRLESVQREIERLTLRLRFWRVRDLVRQGYAEAHGRLVAEREYPIPQV